MGLDEWGCAGEKKDQQEIEVEIGTLLKYLTISFQKKALSVRCLIVTSASPQNHKDVIVQAADKRAAANSSREEVFNFKTITNKIFQ